MMIVLILIFGILILLGSIIFVVLIANNKYRFALGYDRELTRDLTSLKE
ncbi:TPA: hypothetical protein ACGO3I_000274 [Streptococcus suis]